ncbi:MAG: beta-lactamase family protein [Microthrixaceae bacterium]|nr:beta-lactamase family protein [Microthrixaceae bacterium]
MDGTAHPDFERVAREFERQLARTAGGAAVTVYHCGEPVVDLWGGLRGEDEPWERDTLAMCFSTTKGVASFAVHLLADRGLLDYDAPVATYWPSCAERQEGVTVRHVLRPLGGPAPPAQRHRPGHHMLDWDHMVDALARGGAGVRGRHAVRLPRPHLRLAGWQDRPPGRREGSRRRRRRGHRRSLGLDGLHLGCPTSERHRVAPLEPSATPAVGCPGRYGRSRSGWASSAARRSASCACPSTPGA